jgi:hypothetical protein
MKRTIDEQRDELRRAAEERKALSRRMSSTPPSLERRIKRKLRRILKR